MNIVCYCVHSQMDTRSRLQLHMRVPSAPSTRCHGLVTIFEYFCARRRCRMKTIENLCSIRSFALHNTHAHTLRTLDGINKQHQLAHVLLRQWSVRYDVLCDASTGHHSSQFTVELICGRSFWYFFLWIIVALIAGDQSKVETETKRSTYVLELSCGIR